MLRVALAGVLAGLISGAASPPMPPLRATMEAFERRSCAGRPASVGEVVRVDTRVVETPDARFRIADPEHLRFAGGLSIAGFPGPIIALAPREGGRLLAATADSWLLIDPDWQAGFSLPGLEGVEEWPLQGPATVPPHALVSIGVGGAVVAAHGNSLYGYDVPDCGYSASGVELVEFTSRPNAITVTDYSRLLVVGDTTDGRPAAFVTMFSVPTTEGGKTGEDMDFDALETNRILSDPADQAVALANPYQILPVGLIGLWRTAEGRQRVNQFDLNTFMHFDSREPTDPRLLLEIEGLEVSALTAAYPGSGSDTILILMLPDPDAPGRQLLLVYVSTDPAA